MTGDPMLDLALIIAAGMLIVSVVKPDRPRRTLRRGTTDGRGRWRKLRGVL